MTPHPEVLTYTDTKTTNAGAGTTNLSNLLASPGAGSRYRVFAVMASARPTNTGNIQIRIQGSAFDTSLCTLGIDQNGGDGQSFYPQGLPMEEDQAMDITDRSDQASQNYYITVHYVVEEVS